MKCSDTDSLKTMHHSRPLRPLPGRHIKVVTRSRPVSNYMHVCPPSTVSTPPVMYLDAWLDRKIATSPRGRRKSVLNDH